MKDKDKTDDIEKKLNLTDTIYLSIKNDIIAQVFQPGEKLNIKELARKYNVSDTPVKQALQRLMDEKMVVNTPNKGMSIRTLTSHEMNDIFDMRLMMDTFFAKDIIATLNYNDTLRQQIIDNLTTQKNFIENNDSSHMPEEYFTLDLEFHTLFLTASGNQKAVDVFRELQPFTYATGRYVKQPYSRDCECVKEHEAILEAAFAGDLEKLQEAITAHLNNSKNALQLIFKVNRMISAE